MILNEETALGSPPGPEKTASIPVRPLPAGFLRRGVAIFIDLVIFQFLSAILFLSGTLALSLSLSVLPDSVELGRLVLPFTLAWFVLFFTYFSFFHYYGGQTPGKMLVRIKVTTEDGEPVPLPRAILRTLCYFFSSILLLGFLLALIDRRGRALHDILARTEASQS